MVYLSAPRVNPPLLHSLLRESPVVVTGMGVFCGAGASVRELWATVLHGESPAVWLPDHLSPSGHRIAAVRATEPPVTRLTRKMDRSAQLAYAAAAEAWHAAQLDLRPVAPERIGVFVGTSRGAVGKLAECVVTPNLPRARPSDAAHCSLANISGMLSLAFPAHGPALTVSATCASGAAAIVVAAQQILLGEVDVALAGGAEAPLNPIVIAQLHATGILGHATDPHLTCKPFDTARNGIVLGEGAGFLVLESQASALRRSASCLARLTGWALAAEGSERVGMDRTGASLSRVITESLRMAEITPTQLGYLNAHGTGTVLNDLAEANALGLALGEAVANIPCSSTKAVTGHCLGASAALEAVIAMLAMKEGILPGTVNCRELDREANLNVLQAAQTVQVNSVLSISAGFWGNQAALVFQAV
ncbi:MAG: beta-ketoacyl-[acyl-carrier-protein] synthase family protein [Verrucomicrobia bacterium]|nr:beta-ketoacyl-[acyl-carrier-protein] synthase family protein [Verrucomicrobiota bacterium]NBU08809.1 beta-ketoacyl-[acyl-carrier-protein] synthase family protein [Pseudomonadota bacterium]NDA65233.1 beta-ketoacyl-[acyl-carrier-protein] synthase family protein [Verrucomicrobiota bacterium]NDB74113.1 beta-ketoacyl-[acyl-carrier-protein] synthase family protein [Verrucomicrobiota bacterium]NDD37063.1 beta-ketoacyl-[acyl-carrier-protein] synthase family protein [Verrucomicrobiota bacterium]